MTEQVYVVEHGDESHGSEIAGVHKTLSGATVSVPILFQEWCKRFGGGQRPLRCLDGYIFEAGMYSARIRPRTLHD